MIGIFDNFHFLFFSMFQVNVVKLLVKWVRVGVQTSVGPCLISIILIAWPGVNPIKLFYLLMHIIRRLLLSIKLICLFLFVTNAQSYPRESENK